MTRLWKRKGNQEGGKERGRDRLRKCPRSKETKETWQLGESEILLPGIVTFGSNNRKEGRKEGREERKGTWQLNAVCGPGLDARLMGNCSKIHHWNKWWHLEMDSLLPKSIIAILNVLNLRTALGYMEESGLAVKKYILRYLGAKNYDVSATLTCFSKINNNNNVYLER